MFWHVLHGQISVIENLGMTLDQFDAIDFSGNQIIKMDGFLCWEDWKLIGEQ